MFALRLAALWLGLIAQASVPPARETGGEVIVDALEVLDEADPAGYPTAELKKGDRVLVVGTQPPGWLAIKPPTGSFHWLDASAILDKNDGTGEVIVDQATVRSGASGAKLPGPPRSTLSKGATVRLLDRPRLTIGSGTKARTWRAIAMADGEVHYVQAEDVKLDGSKTVDPLVVATQANLDGGNARSAISRFEAALERSRQLDYKVAQIKQKLAIARAQTDRSYDAKGFLQASSRKVDGEKIHALIGPQGVPIAYLSIPPGISTNRLLARKVGVRGDVHYNEGLGTRLITVKDIDPLDKPR